MMQDFTGTGKVVESIEKGTLELRQLLYDFISPSAKEAGNLLADKVKFLRFKQSTKALHKAKDILVKEGVYHYEIEMRNLFPLIEKCSLESDETLIDKWANLIATASVESDFSPGFIQMLSSISPIEAKLLDYIFSNGEAMMKMGLYRYFGTELYQIISGLEVTRANCVVYLTNLEQMGLLRRIQRKEPGLMFGNPPLGTMQGDIIGLTPLGGRFMLACHRDASERMNYPRIELEEVTE